MWNGIRLIYVPTHGNGPMATVIFDFRAVVQAARRADLVLTLGYNTAIFLLWFKLHCVTNLINMDGIEWRRSKWSFPARCWLYLNERMAPWFADHLIADHPLIKTHHSQHTAASRITTIPYGSPQIEDAQTKVLTEFGLSSAGYVLLVARPEPENSVFEIVQAFCACRRGLRLVIVGEYCPGAVDYQQHVYSAANDEVLFIGPQYDHARLSALRYHAKLYVHGHRVGGTNPSLVEAMGAGNPILAHNNAFNVWVAGPENAYFDDVKDCAEQFDRLLGDNARLELMRLASRARHNQFFQWPKILEQYETLLDFWHLVSRDRHGWVKDWLYGRTR